MVNLIPDEWEKPIEVILAVSGIITSILGVLLVIDRLGSNW